MKFVYGSDRNFYKFAKSRHRLEPTHCMRFRPRRQLISNEGKAVQGQGCFITEKCCVIFEVKKMLFGNRPGCWGSFLKTLQNNNLNVKQNFLQHHCRILWKQHENMDSTITRQQNQNFFKDEQHLNKWENSFLHIGIWVNNLKKATGTNITF